MSNPPPEPPARPGQNRSDPYDAANEDAVTSHLEESANPPSDVPPRDESLARPHDPYVALRNANFRRYFIGNAFSLIGMQMAAVSVGWELYARTNSAVALGLVGLVQVIPIIALALPAGHLVDRVSRKGLVIWATAILIVSYTLMGLSSRYADSGSLGDAQGGLLGMLNHGLEALAGLFGENRSRFEDRHVPILFLLLLVNGVCRAVNQPAKQSLLPMLVEPEHFPNAVTWNSSQFEMTNVIGPMIAGFGIAMMQGPSVHGTWAYAVIYWANAACQVVQLVNIVRISLRETPRLREPMTLKSMLAGVSFLRREKVILGAITLDMFAVLLGGATALLPLYARDILRVGPMGLGWLRAALSIGAMSMAMILAHRPPMRKAGRNLLWAVGGFGVATVVFGLATSFWVSIAALIVLGAFDNISVVVRHSLVQLFTPDAMRGRVNAVNSVFISSSNELGAFESGATAAVGIRFLGPILGPMMAVAAGGVGTILVVLAVAWGWPQVGAVKRLAHPDSK